MGRAARAVAFGAGATGLGASHGPPGSHWSVVRSGRRSSGYRCTGLTVPAPKASRGGYPPGCIASDPLRGLFSAGWAARGGSIPGSRAVRSGNTAQRPGPPRNCSYQRAGDPPPRTACRPSHTASIPLPRRELAAWKSESPRLVALFTNRDSARRVSRFSDRRMNRDPRRRGSRFGVAARGATSRAEDHVSCSVAKHDRRRQGPRFVPPPRSDPSRQPSSLATEARPVSWGMPIAPCADLSDSSSRARSGNALGALRSARSAARSDVVAPVARGR